MAVKANAINKLCYVNIKLNKLCLKINNYYSKLA